MPTATEAMLVALIGAGGALLATWVKPFIEEWRANTRATKILISDLRDINRHLFANVSTIEQILQESTQAKHNSSIISRMYVEKLRISREYLLYDKDVVAYLSSDQIIQINLMRIRFRNYNINCDQLLLFFSHHEQGEFYRMMEWMIGESNRLSSGIERLITGYFDSRWRRDEARVLVNDAKREFFWEPVKPKAVQANKSNDRK
jgi:hypothetical protein